MWRGSLTQYMYVLCIKTESSKSQLSVLLNWFMGSFGNVCSDQPRRNQMYQNNGYQRAYLLSLNIYTVVSKLSRTFPKHQFRTKKTHISRGNYVMWGDVYAYVKGCIVEVNRIKMDIFQPPSYIPCYKIWHKAIRESY